LLVLLELRELMVQLVLVLGEVEPLETFDPLAD
jgi:hypothetical protein